MCEPPSTFRHSRCLSQINLLPVLRSPDDASIIYTNVRILVDFFLKKKPKTFSENFRYTGFIYLLTYLLSTYLLVLSISAPLQDSMTLNRPSSVENVLVIVYFYYHYLVTRVCNLERRRHSQATTLLGLGFLRTLRFEYSVSELFQYSNEYYASI